jgi:hypothetical protein
MKPLSPLGRPSRRLAVLLLALTVGLPAAPAAAGDLELAVQGGRALPFYSQSFAFDPGDLLPPDIPVTTSDGFTLDLGGGLTVAGALTWRFTDSLGLEARVDTAKVDLEVTGGTVGVDLGNLLPGLPSIPISGDLEGQTEIGRLIPFSLNLQFQAGEKVRFVVSGGLSYIPSTTVSATVGVGLGGDIPGLPPIALPPIGVSASATLDGGIGGNLGLGLRVPVSSSVALVFDARAFGFPTKTLEWGPGGGESSTIEEVLAASLDPIEFQYGFFQAAGGIAFTF